MYEHSKHLTIKGKPLSETGRALVMIHGRGATADNILQLQIELGLDLDDITLFAPQATNNSWYPYSFMAPVAKNQPALDTALQLIDEVVSTINSQGVENEKIYFLGFSQGACLTLEYTARHAGKYGGIIAFTGGLIGEKLTTENYQGDFKNTPVLLTTGDQDPHIPLKRAEESVKILAEMGAAVQFKVYQGRPHTILPGELELAKVMF